MITDEQLAEYEALANGVDDLKHGPISYLDLAEAVSHLIQDLGFEGPEPYEYNREAFKKILRALIPIYKRCKAS